MGDSFPIHWHMAPNVESLDQRLRDSSWIETAEVIKRHHRRGVYHQDLKPSNWMVAAHMRMPHVPLVLVDLDRITVGRRVSLRRRTRNLLQVLAGCRDSGASLEGARFLVSYGAEAGISRQEQRHLLVRIWAALQQ